MKLERELISISPKESNYLYSPNYLNRNKKPFLKSLSEILTIPNNIGTNANSIEVKKNKKIKILNTKKINLPKIESYFTNHILLLNNALNSQPEDTHKTLSGVFSSKKPLESKQLKNKISLKKNKSNLNIYNIHLEKEIPTIFNIRYYNLNKIKPKNINTFGIDTNYLDNYNKNINLIYSKNKNKKIFIQEYNIYSPYKTRFKFNNDTISNLYKNKDKEDTDIYRSINKEKSRIKKLIKKRIFHNVFFRWRKNYYSFEDNKKILNDYLEYLKLSIKNDIKILFKFLVENKKQKINQKENIQSKQNNEFKRNKSSVFVDKLPSYNRIIDNIEQNKNDINNLIKINSLEINKFRKDYNYIMKRPHNYTNEIEKIEEAEENESYINSLDKNYNNFDLTDDKLFNLIKSKNSFRNIDNIYKQKNIIKRNSNINTNAKENSINFSQQNYPCDNQKEKIDKKVNTSFLVESFHNEYINSNRNNNKNNEINTNNNNLYYKTNIDFNYIFNNNNNDITNITNYNNLSSKTEDDNILLNDIYHTLNKFKFIHKEEKCNNNNNKEDKKNKISEKNVLKNDSKEEIKINISQNKIKQDDIIENEKSENKSDIKDDSNTNEDIYFNNNNNNNKFIDLKRNSLNNTNSNNKIFRERKSVDYIFIKDSGSINPFFDEIDLSKFKFNNQDTKNDVNNINPVNSNNDNNDKNGNNDNNDNNEDNDIETEPKKNKKKNKNKKSKKNKKKKNKTEKDKEENLESQIKDKEEEKNVIEIATDFRNEHIYSHNNENYEYFKNNKTNKKIYRFNKELVFLNKYQSKTKEEMEKEKKIKEKHELEARKYIMQKNLKNLIKRRDRRSLFCPNKDILKDLNTEDTKFNKTLPLSFRRRKTQELNSGKYISKLLRDKLLFDNSIKKIKKPKIYNLKNILSLIPKKGKEKIFIQKIKDNLHENAVNISFNTNIGKNTIYNIDDDVNRNEEQNITSISSKKSSKFVLKSKSIFSVKKGAVSKFLSQREKNKEIIKNKISIDVKESKKSDNLNNFFDRIKFYKNCGDKNIIDEFINEEIDKNGINEKRERFLRLNFFIEDINYLRNAHKIIKPKMKFLSPLCFSSPSIFKKK